MARKSTEGQETQAQADKVSEAVRDNIKAGTDFNMRLWEKVDKPPQEALKAIQAGRLKGKTDINPQWRLKVMTELFGPCGEGWKYEIIDMMDRTCGDEVVVRVRINLYVKITENLWSDPIPGVGGSMLIENESRGLHVNDEAYKMALTDALSVAMKQLGVASAIYEGRWDGSKYRDDDKREPQQRRATAPAQPAQPAQTARTRTAAPPPEQRQAKEPTPPPTQPANQDKFVQEVKEALATGEWLDEGGIKDGVMENSFVADVVIEDVQVQTGKTAKGRAWTRTHGKGDDGHYYSTFDQRIGCAMELKQSDPITLRYTLSERDGKTRNVNGIAAPAVVTGGQASNGAPPDTDDLLPF